MKGVNEKKEKNNCVAVTIYFMYIRYDNLASFST